MDERGVASCATAKPASFDTLAAPPGGAMGGPPYDGGGEANGEEEVPAGGIVAGIGRVRG